MNPLKNHIFASATSKFSKDSNLRTRAHLLTVKALQSYMTVHKHLYSTK
jgi:hypothetical protein